MMQKLHYKFILAATTILVWLVFITSFRQNFNSNSKPLNLIIISIDTLRPDHMGVYGYDKNTTPNIDAWAKDAIVFSNMHTIIPATYPSFAILQTGMHPLESMIINNGVVNGRVYKTGPPIRDQVNTLAEILKNNGYKTAAFLTNPVLEKSYTNLDQGFSEYYLKSVWDGYPDRTNYLTLLNNALTWISDNKNEKIYLWIHLMDPHAPYTPNTEYECKFNENYCSEIKSKGFLKLDDERKKYEGCQKEDLQQEKIDVIETLYDGTIATSDDFVGKILKKIQDSGLDKNSVVLLYGDHGEGFENQYYFTHSHAIYESSTRIPFLAKIPNQKVRIVENLLDNTSIFPFLLNALNLKTTPDKKSSNPWNSINPKDSRDNYIYAFNTNLSKYSIQNQDYKFIYSIPGFACLNKGQKEELYDLKKDPSESINLLIEKPEITNRFKTSLLNYFRNYGLPKPLNNEALDVEYNSPEEIKKTIEILKNVGY